MFENTALVERFLNYWRTTGHQRMGYLYGSYEVINDVPLGIRARVAAIYEPPQESTRNSIKLTPDERAEEIDELAAKLGLRKVGWIFTDLIADNAALGTVKHIRGIDTHFLTAPECIMAGHLQNQHPNICKYSSNGSFGSKFVTVCVTGERDIGFWLRPIVIVIRMIYICFVLFLLLCVRRRFVKTGTHGRICRIRTMHGIGS